MVELQEAEVTEQVESPEVPQTAGSLLRQAREAAGMQASTLAEMLKVPVTKLQALEADDWKTLPDAVFTRSLALSVCKALHIEAAPVMALMPKSTVSQKFTAPGPGINEPFRDKAVRSVYDTPNSGAGWKVLGAVVLVAAAGGAWYFSQQEGLRDAVVASVQERSDRAMGTSSSNPSEVSAQPEVASPVVPSMEAPANHGSETTVPVAAVEPAAPVAAAVEVAPAVAPVAAASAAAPAVAEPSATAAAVASSAATLRIQASSATWIQVRGGGKVLEQKTLNAGEFFETQAPKPLSVVIGRADAAEVHVGGATFDLGAVARENVARFEVK